MIKKVLNYVAWGDSRNKVKENAKHTIKIFILYLLGAAIVYSADYHDVNIVNTILGLIPREIHELTVASLLEGVRNYLKHRWGFKSL